MEQNNQNLDYITNEEETIFEMILNKKWKHISHICLKMLDMKDR